MASIFNFTIPEWENTILSQSSEPTGSDPHSDVPSNIPVHFVVDGKPCVIEPGTLDKIRFFKMPGFDNFIRGYAHDHETGLEFVAWLHVRGGNRILRLTVSNSRHHPVLMECSTIDGTPVLDHTGSTQFHLGPRSGYAWTDSLYGEVAMGGIGNGGDENANKILARGPRYAPDTSATGSSNMNFYLPAKALHDWFGRSRELANYFNGYWEFQQRRPRHWMYSLDGSLIGISPISRFSDDSPRLEGFSMYQKNPYGMNACDSQHADFLEFFDGFDIYRDPAFFEGALSGWSMLWRNGWEVDPDKLRYKLETDHDNVYHSPRVLGWDMHNTGRLLGMLSVSPAGYAWHASELLTWAEFHLDTAVATFPEKWCQPASWTLDGEIKAHGKDVFSPWQIASTVPWGFQEVALGARKLAVASTDPVLQARANDLATAADAFAEDVLDYEDEHDFDEARITWNKFRTIDGAITKPSSFPGIGNWPIAAGLRSPKGRARRSIDMITERLVSAKGLNPYREEAITNYRPLIEDEHGLG